MPKHSEISHVLVVEKNGVVYGARTASLFDLEVVKLDVEPRVEPDRSKSGVNVPDRCICKQGCAVD